MKSRKINKNRIFLLVLVFVIAALIGSLSSLIVPEGYARIQHTAYAKTLSVNAIKKKLKSTAPKTVATKRDGDKAYIEINGNKPYFKTSWLTKRSFEYYSPLDKLGRCGTTFACIGKDLMPTEERDSIGMVKPTGWHTIKYDRSIISDLYLYNRCHLIGYQLTGENANTKNLITGTRFLNVSGMLPFEDKVADAVKYKKVHVLYRVTPIYTGKNLVADGVLMEAMSCEDKGKTLQFCVFCPNIQPGIVIDYSNGDSKLEDSGTKDNNKTDNSNSSGNSEKYILNTNTHRFHYPSCGSVNDMAAHNKKESTESRDEIIAKGYVPCGRCKP